MPDLLHGEIDLTAPAPPEPAPAPVAAPEPEPVAEPAPEPEAVVEAPAAPIAAAPQKPGGMLGELIAERKERKELADRLRQYEADPVLQRLTPDVRQALAEGRLVVAPPKSNPEAERERLTDIASRYILYKVDAAGNQTPDLDAAARVDKGIRETVREEMAPLTHMTLSQKAVHYTSIAVDHATKTMGPEQAAVVREEYERILQQPNGAQMLSQPEVAKTVWKQAIGTLHERGLLTGAKPPAPARVDPAAPVIAPVTGRRAPQAAIQLSPALQQVYKNHGLDPAKVPSASKLPAVDAQGYMALE